MTRSELVKRAISFDSPSRVPVWFWNEDKERSDIHSFELFPYKGDVKTSEWGYVWEDLGDGTIGQPKKPVIPTWDGHWQLSTNHDGNMIGEGAGTRTMMKIESCYGVISFCTILLAATVTVSADEASKAEIGYIRQEIPDLPIPEDVSANPIGDGT